MVLSTKTQIFVFVCLCFIACCLSDTPSSSSSSSTTENENYWSSSWYTLKPDNSAESEESEESEPTPPKTGTKTGTKTGPNTGTKNGTVATTPKTEPTGTAPNTPPKNGTKTGTKTETSTSTSQEEEIDVPELIYQGLPFIIGIQAKSPTDDKGELILGNITDISGDYTYYSEYLPFQMNILLTTMLFSSDCKLYVGINSGYSVYDWQSLNLLQQIQVNQTGLPYTPTTRGMAFGPSDTIILADPYGRISSYHQNGTFLEIVGTLDFHGHLSSMLYNNSQLFIGIHGEVRAFDYPSLVSSQNFSLPVYNSTDENDSIYDVYSLGLYASNSSLFYATTGYGLYLLNASDSTQVEEMLPTSTADSIFSFEYSNSIFDSVNGLLTSNIAAVGELVKYSVENGTTISDPAGDVVFVTQSSKNLMRFVVVPDECVANATNSTETYPPVVGTYNQTSCNFVNLTDTNYGVNATFLSCQAEGSSLTIISQQGSIIVIQVTYYSSSDPEMKAATTPSTLQVEAILTISGDIFFTIPLEGTSYAQCYGEYQDEEMQLSCVSFYSPSVGGVVALSDTNSVYQCEAGSCKAQSTNAEDADGGSLWWISLIVLGVVGIAVLIVAVVAFVIYKKNQPNVLYEPIEE